MDGGWFEVRKATREKVSNPKSFMNADPQKMTRCVQVRYPFVCLHVLKLSKFRYKMCFSSFLTCTVRHCLKLGSITTSFSSFLATFYCHCGNDMPKLSLHFMSYPVCERYYSRSECVQLLVGNN